MNETPREFSSDDPGAWELTPEPWFLRGPMPYVVACALGIVLAEALTHFILTFFVGS